MAPLTDWSRSGTAATEGPVHPALSCYRGRVAVRTRSRSQTGPKSIRLKTGTNRFGAITRLWQGLAGFGRVWQGSKEFQKPAKPAISTPRPSAVYTRQSPSRQSIIIEPSKCHLLAPFDTFWHQMTPPSGARPLVTFGKYEFRLSRGDGAGDGV